MNYIWSNFQDSRTAALFLFWKLYRLITASKSETSIFIAYNNISEYNKLRFCTHRVYRRNANPLSRRIIITIQFMNPHQYSYSGKFWKFIPMHTRSRSKKKKFNSIQKRQTCPSIPEDTNSIRNQFRFNKDSRPPPPLHHFLHPDIIRVIHCSISSRDSSSQALASFGRETAEARIPGKMSLEEWNVI